MRCDEFATLTKPAEPYLPGSLLSILVDGLAYRYYWATQAIRRSDMNFKATADARSIEELMAHILDLSEGVRNTIQGQVIQGQLQREKQSYTQVRNRTFENLKLISQFLLGKQNTELSSVNLALDLGDRMEVYGLEAILVGPLTDMGYHIGQIVYLRRCAGNPIARGVNPFMEMGAKKIL